VNPPDRWWQRLRIGNAVNKHQAFQGSRARSVEVKSERDPDTKRVANQG